MNETRTLVDFVVKTGYEDLPAETIERAKLCILDTIGVTIFGSQLPWARMVAEMAREAGAAGESTVWGQSFKTSPQLAALVNGTTAHSFELDDYTTRATLHPGVVTIPAAFGVGEKLERDGRSLLAAVVLGYEVIFRVGKATLGQIFRGFHPTGCNGPFGAAAAAGKMLKLDEKQMLNAFGIAGSLASGLMEFVHDPEGTMIKRMYGGRPSEGGVMSALLAQKGFTGPSTVLEGKYGYCQVYAPEKGPNIEELTKGLGQHYAIMEREVKPYAACGALHSTMDAINQLKSQYRIDYRSVERVAIEGPSFVWDGHEIREPKSAMSAQYSTPYAAAVALVKNALDPKVFTEEAIRDGTVLKLAQKVDFTLDQEFEKVSPQQLPVRVTVTLNDGRRVTASVPAAKGSYDSPMTAAEIREKFRVLAGQVLSSSRGDKIIETVDKLDKIDDVRQLGELLSA